MASEFLSRYIESSKGLQDLRAGEEQSQARQQLSTLRDLQIQDEQMKSELAQLQQPVQRGLAEQQLGNLPQLQQTQQMQQDIDQEKLVEQTLRQSRNLPETFTSLQQQMPELANLKLVEKTLPGTTTKVPAVFNPQTQTEDEADYLFDDHEAAAIKFEQTSALTKVKAASKKPKKTAQFKVSRKDIRASIKEIPKFKNLDSSAEVAISSDIASVINDVAKSDIQISQTELKNKLVELAKDYIGESNIPIFGSDSFDSEGFNKAAEELLSTITPEKEEELSDEDVSSALDKFL